MERRITPDEVLAAYAKTGLRPVFGAYTQLVGTVNCGCPLAAIYAASTGNAPHSDGIVEWADATLGDAYATAFTAGADDRNSYVTTARAILNGYADGQAVRKAIIEAGLMEAGA